MKRFCKNCGKEARPEHHVCIYCGTKLRTDNPSDETSVNMAEPRDGEDSLEQHDVETWDKAGGEASEFSERKDEAPREVEEIVSRQDRQNRNGKTRKRRGEKRSEKKQHSSANNKKRVKQQSQSQQQRSQEKSADETNRKANKKRPTSASMSKRSKRILSTIGLLAVVLIGFTLWAQSYQSPEAVEKRFAEAVKEGDTGALQKLVIHENGSPAAKGEVEALIKLVEEEGDYVIDDLFTIEPHGKFLWLYQAHKAKAIDQFAYYPDPIEGLDFSFNEVEPTVRKKTFYGPLIPGMYDVQAQFKGDYGETTKEGQITLADDLGEEVYLDMDVNVAEVTFYIENQDDIDIADSYIKLGDEKIAINADGYTDSVGPLIIDGSQQAQTVASTPWGDIESEPFDISEQDMSIQAALLSADDFENVSELLTDFGETYVEAFAENDVDVMENVSDDVKQYLEDSMIHSLNSDDWFYSGEFTQLNIDRDSIQPTGDTPEPELALNAEYSFNEAYHPLDEDPDFHENTVLLSMTLDYDDEWMISSIEEDYWGIFEATDTIDGSATTHSPSEDAIQAQTELALKDDMGDFIKDYTEASVKAINQTDFFYVENYIEEDSPRYDEARDYIDYLDSKNITEELLSVEIESIDPLDDSTWEVTLLESFTIISEDSTSDKDFRTKVVVKDINGQFYVHELIETDEI